MARPRRSTHACPDAKDSAYRRHIENHIRAGNTALRSLAPCATATLLLPSADNVAWILARWDAGSAAALVDRMNTVAHQLGMTSTRYTDPSGLAASTTSSAADQVRLGVAAMGQPALAGIAGQSSALIPVAGTVDSLNSLLGEDGIVGLKTGSTSAAGGCVLLAAFSTTGHRRALTVVAVFGEPGSPDTILSVALHAGQRLLIEIERNIGVPAALVSDSRARDGSVRRSSAAPRQRDRSLGPNAANAY